MTAIYDFMTNILRPLTAKGDLLVKKTVGYGNLPVGADGQVHIADSSKEAAYRSGYRLLDVPMHVAASAFATWTSMPSADTIFLGSSRWNQAALADLTDYTQCRLCFVVGTAGVSGAKIKAKYATSFSTSVGSYSDLGTSEVSAVLTTGSVHVTSGWINLAAGAKADVFLILTGSGGDGSTSPTIGNAHIQFR